MPRAYYTLLIRPYYRAGRKSSNEYEGVILEHEDFRYEEGTGKPVWRIVKALRRDVKVLGEDALRDYRAAAGPPKPISVLEDKRHYVSGMFGRTHSEETKAKISAGIKAAYESGRRAPTRVGRLSNAALLERTRAAAEAAGLTVSRYVAKQDELRQERDAQRREVQRKHSFPVSPPAKKTEARRLRELLKKV